MGRGKQFVFVKANYIKYNFKRVGEYINPDTSSFVQAIQHKIYIPQEAMDKFELRDNKKMLCSFLTVRVIDENSLMTFGSGDTIKIALDIPVERKDFKAGEMFAFEQAVVNFFRRYVPTDLMKNTHLQVSGVLNHEKFFGIHYTVLIPKELENYLKKSELNNGKTLSIVQLQDKYKDSLDSVSELCIKNYRGVNNKNG